MKLHFDSNQQYQWNAIKSITDIFEEQPLTSGDFEFSINDAGALLTENGFENKLILPEDQIVKNVKSSLRKLYTS
jgi:type III restriction enzyme